MLAAGLSHLRTAMKVDGAGRLDPGFDALYVRVAGCARAGRKAATCHDEAGPYASDEDLSRLVTTGEAARVLGVSAAAVRQAAGAGHLQGKQLTPGGRWWFTREELDRYANRPQVAAARRRKAA